MGYTSVYVETPISYDEGCIISIYHYNVKYHQWQTLLYKAYK